MIGQTKHNKMINNVYYVFEFINGEICFYVDPYKSTCHIDMTTDETKADPFDNEPATTRLFRRVPSDAPIKVYAESVRFVHKIIATERPHNFSYEATERTRWPLYERAAKRIGKRFGYNVYSWADGDTKRWEFYKSEF